MRVQTSIPIEVAKTLEAKLDALGIDLNTYIRYLIVKDLLGEEK